MKGGTFLTVLVAGISPLLILIILILGISLGLVAWRPPLLWSDQFGVTNDYNGVTAAGVDNTGVYVGGYQNATNRFYNSPMVSFLTKYDSGGTRVWTSSAVKLQNYRIYGVAAENGFAYIVGGVTDTNLTIMKLDQSGDLFWTRQMGTGNNAALASTGGELYVVASSSYGASSDFVSDYDSKGNVVWTSIFLNNSENVLGVYAGRSGAYVLTNTYLVGFSLNGTRLWMHRYWAIGAYLPSSITGDDTGIYVSGSQTATSPVPQGFISKYGFDGIFVWGQGFTALDGSGGVGSASDAADSSGVYVSTSTGAVAGNVWKYNSNGGEVWSFQTPIKPSMLINNLDFFLVAVSSGVFYLTGGSGAGPGSGYTLGMVAAFGESSSLVFFGLNPPFSFITVAGLVAAIVGSVIFLRRRYSRKTVLRTKGVSGRIR